MNIAKVVSKINKYFWFKKVSKAGKMFHPNVLKIAKKKLTWTWSAVQTKQVATNVMTQKKWRLTGASLIWVLINWNRGLKCITLLNLTLKKKLEWWMWKDKQLGAGAYLKIMRRSRLIPNFVQMYGYKIKLSYPGVKNSAKMLQLPLKRRQELWKDILHTIQWRLQRKQLKNTGRHDWAQQRG